MPPGATRPALREGAHSFCCPHSSNSFFFEASGLIEAKLHIKPPLVRGTKICSRGLGHHTKMAAMPIYNPLFIFFSLESMSQRPGDLVCSPGDTSPLDVSRGYFSPVLPRSGGLR